jgi:hypothetical protein
MPKRPDWTRPLPRPLQIPKVMTLRTLADVRKLLRHVPADRRKLPRWQGVANDLKDAAVNGDVSGAAISLRLVLFMERVECRW